MRRDITILSACGGNATNLSSARPFHACRRHRPKCSLNALRKYSQHDEDFIFGELVAFQNMDVKDDKPQFTRLIKMAIVVASLNAGAAKAEGFFDFLTPPQNETLVPMETILKAARTAVPGQVMEIEIKRKRWIWIYEVEVSSKERQAQNGACFRRADRRAGFSPLALNSR